MLWLVGLVGLDFFARRVAIFGTVLRWGDYCFGVFVLWLRCRCTGFVCTLLGKPCVCRCWGGGKGICELFYQRSSPLFWGEHASVFWEGL